MVNSRAIFKVGPTGRSLGRLLIPCVGPALCFGHDENREQNKRIKINQRKINVKKKEARNRLTLARTAIRQIGPNVISFLDLHLPTSPKVAIAWLGDMSWLLVWDEDRTDAAFYHTTSLSTKNRGRTEQEQEEEKKGKHMLLAKQQDSI